MNTRASYQTWPPPQRADLIHNVIALGVLLGLIEGVVVGALSGVQHDDLEYGCVAGMGMGVLYGGLTGWAFSHARRSSTLRFGLRVLPAICWLVGALIIGLSAAALAAIGDTHEFWSAPLAFVAPPFLGLFVAIAVEVVLAENRGPSHEHRTGVMDLLDPNQFTESVVARKLVCLLLLLAIKDKAKAIQFERNRREVKILYWVNNAPVEMVPPPTSIMPSVFKEVMVEANMVIPLWARLLMRLWLFQAHLSRHYGSGRLRLRCGEATIDVAVSVRFSRHGELLTLHLPDTTQSSEEIARHIAECLETKEVVPDTEIKHVCQGQGNCAIASIATVAGVSYDEALAKRSNPKKKGGPSLKEMLFLLATLTGAEWQIVTLNIMPRRLDEIGFPDWPVLVLIRPPCRFFTIHCIVVNRNVVHDPGWLHPFYLDAYCCKGWRAIGAFQPHRAVKKEST